MFDPVVEMLPVVTVAPAEQRAKEKMRPIFYVSVSLHYRCLQKLIFISAREMKNMRFLWVFSDYRWILRRCQNLYERILWVVNVSFMAFWNGRIPTGQSSGTRIGEVWRDMVTLSFMLPPAEQGAKKKQSHSLTLAHRCLQLRRSKDGRLSSELLLR